MNSPNAPTHTKTRFIEALYASRDELLARLYEEWWPPEALAYAANSLTLQELREQRHQLAAHSPRLPAELLRSNTLFGIPLIEDPSLPIGQLRCVVRPGWLY